MKAYLYVPLLVLAVAVVVYLGWLRRGQPTLCGGEMDVFGARCCGFGQTLDAKQLCRGRPSRCPPGLRASDHGCLATPRRIEVPGGRLDPVASSDWEKQASEQRISVSVAAFWLDSHEVSEAGYRDCVQAKQCMGRPQRGEASLPQTQLSAQDAARYCRFVGGRLPRLAELRFAASRDGGRYPWGQTGVVCRRVAFGLAQGPCRYGGGPQPVGVHRSGATKSGLHDLAGNVAEWTAEGFAFGGSWRSRQAGDLRVWSFRRPAQGSVHDDIGLRCVYDRARP
jgi:hypothetical protein